ncbi:dihydroneopterin aldolase [candidate division WOR-3 bacterium]|nr:dihydroneopterin aldolase [candidate division WOR-3 bacterium]
MMDRISLRKMKFYAYHGHVEMERNSGVNIEVDAEIFLNLKKAMKTDDLKDTVDYRSVYGVIKEVVMSNKYMLLERVLSKIIEALFASFAQVEGVKVSVRKNTPSLGGIVESVEVYAFRLRSQV